MIKEIEIKGISPKKKTPTDIVDSLPVGSTVNGVTKAKEFTEYEEETEEQEQEGSRKWVLTDDDILTKEQEEELKEKFIQEKTDEIMKGIEDLSKTYVPGENVDRTKRINDMDFIRTVAKLFGLDKYFVPVEPIKQEEKEAYVKPESKIVDGIIGFDEEKKPLSKTFDTICLEIMDLHAKKNKDYGNAAHESYKEFGLISYVIRLNDKMKRLKSLTKPGVEQEVKSESIEDTLMDLAAYAIMAIESLSTWR